MSNRLRIWILGSLAVILVLGLFNSARWTVSGESNVACSDGRINASSYGTNSWRTQPCGPKLGRGACNV
ncbi:MAG: hypothetical protein ACXAEU_26555 [Candidatus Hodarchaeales archaeon]|jgi:hypothetical protein